jgi:GTPase SAR1 family protein
LPQFGGPGSVQGKFDFVPVTPTFGEPLPEPDFLDTRESETLQGNEDYRTFIDQLWAINVDKYIELPTVAVMGDTSSGKSSLLSMLSEIELPSSDQLTTRCPIQLNMTYKEERSATVEVIWKDEDYSDEDEDFPMESFDDSNWDELTSAITRAQQHILDLTENEVARDVVSVKLAGPSCVNLTLIDLPGIVRTTGRGESEALAEEIQDLIDEYLDNSKCVILAILPCNVDFHNSQIMRDAQNVDPDTLRTIPVLTKPDLIDRGAEGAVRDLLLGLKTNEFSKGFHMVKCRGQAALNNKESIDAGLVSEEKFFRSVHPWRDIRDPTLLGTKNLRVKLSEILIDLIKESFPFIISQIRSEMEAASAELAKIGEVPETHDAKRFCFANTKDNITRSLRCALSGTGLSTVGLKAESNCAAKFHAASRQYQDALSTSDFSTLSSSEEISLGDKVVVESNSGTHEGKVVHLDETGDVCLHGVYLTSTEYAPPNGDSYASGEVFQTNSGVFQVTKPGCCKQLKSFPIDTVQKKDKLWLISSIEKYRTISLPMFVSSDLFEKIVSDSIESQWRGPSLTLVNQISSDIKASAMELTTTDEILKRFPRFQNFMFRKLMDVIDKARERAVKRVTEFIDTEIKIAYTQNHYVFENISKKRDEFIFDRIEKRIDFDQDSISTSQLRQILNDAKEYNRKKSVEEQMAEDMLCVLEGYGKVAMKRFIDSVPMICAAELLHGLDQQYNLDLMAVQEKEILSLLHVSKDKIASRQYLQTKLHSLQKAVAIIEELF